MNRWLLVGVLLISVFLVQISSAEAVDCSAHKSCSSCSDHPECGWCEDEGACKDQGDTCYNPLLKTCPPFFTLRLILSSVACFIGGALTSGGGVGGGAIYIPVFILILNVSPHVAIPLSKVTIFGVAIGGFIILVRKRHPKTDRPLIDYSIALLMEPLTLWGTIIGVYMNVTFPTFLLVTFLVLILGFNAYRTYKKGFSLLKEERAEEKRRLLEQQEEKKVVTENQTSVQEEDSDDSSPLLRVQITVHEIHWSQKGEVTALLEKEKKIPWWKFFTLVGIEIGMVVLLLLKGGHGGSIIGVHCGTWQYWAILGSTLPYICIFVLFISRMLNREHRRKETIGYNYLKEDLRWTWKTIFLFCIFSLVAGIAAGFLGIGAGIVIGPLLIEMGVLPQVATATSSYMILFTSSATTAQFLIFGRLEWQPALWFCGIGFCAALLGQYAVAKIVQKYKKQAFINFLLATVILASIILVGVIDGLSIAENLKKHIAIWTFNSICSGSE